MTKCGFCNAELKDSEPICPNCNMYNKEQMLENERIQKVSSKKTIQEEKQKAINDAEYVKGAIASLAMLFLGITFTIFGFYQQAIGNKEATIYSVFFGIVFLGIPLTIIAIRKSNYMLTIDKNNKDAQSFIIRTIIGFSLMLCHNIIGIILALIIYCCMKLLYSKEKR